MIFAHVDIARLRREAAPLFERWDGAVAGGRFDEAVNIRRRELWPLVRLGLACDASKLPGIYAFLDNAGSEGWASITYVGQSEGTLESRMEHYVKDDSCWDSTLNATNVAEAAFRRMRPIMPSTHETLIAHVSKHQTAVRKTRGSSLFFAGFKPDQSGLVLPAEAALIAVAWSNGAPLENDKLERLPRGDQRQQVIEICKGIVRGWGELGLAQSLQEAAEEAFLRAS